MSQALPEVAAVAVVVAVVREVLAVATEAVAVVREVLAVVTEVVAAARDVDPDPRVRRAREDPDPKVDSAAAEARDPRVSRVSNDPDPKVDSAAAEARDPMVSRVNNDPEPRAAEAEDPPELKERKSPLKVRPLLSAPEERELSTMVSTASKARRESNGILLTERTALAEVEVVLRVVLARATGEPLKMRLSKPPLKAPSPRLPLRRSRKRVLPRRRLRLPSRKSRPQLRRTCTLTSSLLLSTLLRRRRLPSRRK
jgi:hypothetical protein